MHKLAEGDQVKEWHIQRQLKGRARNGTRAVWLATTKNGKTTRSGNAIIKEKSDREEFEKEREALSRLGNHPNIAALVDQDEETYALITTYTGRNLPTLWKERIPTLQETMRFAIAHTAGLEHMHRCGVVHLDLNPYNLLIPDEASAPDTAPTIIDMGEARVATAYPLPKRNCAFYRELLINIVFDPDKARRQIQPQTFTGAKQKDIADLGRILDQSLCIAALGYGRGLLGERFFGFGGRLQQITTPLITVLRDAVTYRIASAREFRERLGELSEREAIKTYARI